MTGTTILRMLIRILVIIAVVVIVYLAKKKRDEKTQGSDPAKQSSAKTASANKVNLKAKLSGEEMRILISDLQACADKVPKNDKHIITATTEILQTSGVIPVQVLDLCIAAVQEALSMFSALGMQPASHTELLEKLIRIKNKQNK